ncbi:MAG: hypothetical protein A2624_00245, partial [Gammaproteobacteria bacterium RIFCSPHIGHO2_01_FULL_42_8]
MSYQQRGFSLVEILIALVILAVLTMMLMPAYRAYQLHADRSDAFKSLMALQIAQEKYRIENPTYAALASIWTGSSSYDGHYTMAVSDNTASTYTLTATATGEQINDTGCTVLTLSYLNGTVTKSPST